MKVFKFGGGTLRTAESIKRMTALVRTESNLVVVVSAFNKMTNAFEELVRNSAEGTTVIKLERILNFHEELARDLLGEHVRNWNSRMKPYLKKLNAALKRSLKQPYDLAYDQVVVYGELFSTLLISCYWEQIGLDHRFLDAREIVLTDSNFRDGRVNWEKTAGALDHQQVVDSDPGGLWLIQGFIGGAEKGFSTTLGREGSDYTAAILGNLLEVSEVIIWKDVPGVFTADPAEFVDVCRMEEISYLEAVELSYFGAKVLHPNTIKPLQNKNIPLVVKSLFNPEDPGTRIWMEAGKFPELPVIIKKAGQVLVSIQPRNFSFIVEEALSRIFCILARNKTRINMMQHGAVSVSLVFDWDQEKLDAILGELLPDFKVLYNTGLELWTIRHYTSQSLVEYTKNRRIYVQQQSRKTARFVLG